MTIKKIAKLYDDDFNEVAGMSITNKGIITGTVWQEGGNKPRLAWDINGNPMYGDHAKLDMTALEIGHENDNKR